MRKVIFTILAALVVISAHAQSAGDYQTKQSGDWNTAGTWQRYDGTAFVDATLPPDATAGIITIRNGHTVAVNNEVKGGQVIVEAGGVINWLSGYLNTSLTNNGTFNITNGFNIGNDANPDPVFNNNATLNWSSGYIYFYGATLNNNAAGTFYANDNGQMYLAAGSNLFNNAGTFTKQSGTGGIVISIPWQNSGSVNINEGVFYNNNSLVNTGIFNLASGKTLVNNGSFNWNAGSQLNGSGVFINNNTFILNTALNFPAGITFNQAGGQIQGGNLLTINGVINWTDGYLNTSLTNNGTFNIANGIFIGNDANPDPVFNNNATLNWNSGYIYFYGATLNNNASGTFNTNDNGQMYLSTGSNLFNNAGTFTKQSGTGGIGISIPWQNSGTVNINEGVLYNSNSLVNTGIFNLASGKTLENNGSFNWNAGSQLNGSGVFINNNTFILNTALNFPADITFNQAGGQIQGGNLLTINSVINWTGGYLNTSLTNNGTFNLANDFNIGDNVDPDPVLNNNATFNWNSGNIIFRGATLNNNVSGTINANNNGQMYLATGSNLFNNAGTFTKQNSTSGTIIGIPWQNSGTIIGIGTISSNSTFTNTGIIEPGASPGILQFNGTQPFSATSTLQIEMQDGSGPGTGYDQLTRNENLTLAGKLKVVKAAGFPDGSYTIIQLSYGNISGSFSELDIPEEYNIIINSKNVVLSIVDYDRDGVPDTEDCAPTDASKWQSGTLYIDNDGDGYDNGSETICYGEIPAGYIQTTQGSDCDDNDATVYPGTIELQDGKDNNCDGSVDEGFIWYRDADGDGYGNPENSIYADQAPYGYVADNTDCDDTNAEINPDITWYKDDDNDGYSDGVTLKSCTRPDLFFKLPSELIQTNGDCDDNWGFIYPGSRWINDGVSSCSFGDKASIYECKNNTITLVKQGLCIQLGFRDADGDGDGDPNNFDILSFPLPQGYVQSSSDCNDNDPTIYRGAPELCDGKDNNCNGQVDEGAGAIWYQDSDADGYGDAANSVQACAQPAGYVADNTDCDDNDATVHPGATEVCDGKDNNCNGQVDEGAGAIWYQDSDADGYGDAANSVQACTQPAGYVADNTDCDDNDATVHPGATEVCDGKDNNCNGQVDEGAGAIWYQDSDADGYGDAANSLQACAQPAGYVADNTDCDDNDATVYPGATEICDGKDNNCNGQVDEGAGAIWYQDSDADGYGDAANSVQACAQPAGYVADNTDCDDNDATVYPGATEICDGKDNNCNGQVDEGCTSLPVINIASTLNLEGNKGKRKMRFILTLSSSSAVPVTVHYQTKDGTALAPEDYISKSGVITFPANSRLQVLNVWIKGDTWYEPSETFMVELSQPVNASLGNTEATAIIINDDLLPFVRVQDAQTTEASQMATVRVDLTSPSSLPVTVNYETRNSTAIAPGDYSAVSNATLYFAPGETTKYINIPVVWDAVQESTEQFKVHVLSAENASLSTVLNMSGARRTGTVSIVNSQANNLMPSTRKMKPVLDETKRIDWKVKVQPNPFANSFELVINSEGTEPVMVRIMDRVGRLVKTATFNQTGKPIHMQAVDLKPGLYFAEITQGTQRSVVKLLKVQ